MFKKLSIILLLIFILGSASSYNSAPPKQQLKIYAVHSYEINHFCGSPQYFGFKQKLKEYSDKVDINLRTFYMNTRTVNITPNEKQAISAHIIKQINEFKPDYVVTIDDAAFEYVGIPLSNKYKVVFTGINLPFNEYLKIYPNINQQNIFGVEELFDFSKIITILLEFSNIYILADSTDVSKLLEKNFGEELTKAGFKYSVVYFETIQELHKFLYTQKTKNSVYFVTAQSLFNKDINKYTLFPDILKYISNIIKNLKYPSLVITGNPYSTEFVHLTVSPDFTQMGETAAELLIKDFFNKQLPRKINVATNFVLVNKNLVDRDGFEFILARHHQYVDKVLYY